MAAAGRLPVPRAESWDRQLRAACRNTDSQVFFHPEYERGPARRRREHHAKALCASCPVLHACRRHALLADEPYGVWGGLGETERENLRHDPVARRRLLAASEPAATEEAGTSRVPAQRAEVPARISTPPDVPAPGGAGFP